MQLARRASHIKTSNSFGIKENLASVGRQLDSNRGISRQLHEYVLQLRQKELLGTRRTGTGGRAECVSEQIRAVG